jgi:hypothetical protein
MCFNYCTLRYKELLEEMKNRHEKRNNTSKSVGTKGFYRESAFNDIF